MRIARKASGVVAGAAAAALALTACSGGSGEAGAGDALDTEEEITLNLAWWGDDTRAALYEEAVELFEEEYPNIDVTTTFVAWDDYWTARNTEAASGTLPDVMQMDLSYLRQYGNNGQLLDLSEAFDVNLDVSGLEEELLAAGTVEGAQLGIPTSTNTLALFYNADVLERIGMEPPAEGYTWDDLNDWIVEATEKGAGEDPVVFGGFDYVGTLWFFMQRLIQQGIEPFTEDGQLNFSEEDAAAFLESTAELRDSDAVYPIERTKQIEPLTGFMVSEQAAEMTWDNFMAGYVAETGENIEILPMPSGDNGPQQFWKPSMLLSASANTDQPAAAATLIDFLINEPAVGEIFGTSKGVPATAAQRDAMALEPGSVDEEVTQYEEDVADLVTESAPLPVEGFGAIEAEWKRLHEELLYENVTVDEFVEQWFAFAADTMPAAE
ncbi:ABC transporter substrate-binding protein [Myceligenerans pegani]|uniref:Extracellular solute-binding protein n=1 Tax=Myceligenerans pegani TaxID=2776917 RepID=A0ABR9N4Z7_9MICO|nr:extracellular solute-binding protein [Myceligenerans sp. TRM 65318]MBE1878748.1 extracellular solute-binding protein [Myceligenerans sp. TRM 65318]MBE3021019.1 extracellular solute-binding protein [Myceligenerans sp. TRM 65318]